MERRESCFYGTFPTFVFRPLHISFQQFAETLNRLEADESCWHEFLKDKTLQEAIFLATPVLYEDEAIVTIKTNTNINHFQQEFPT